MYIEGSFREFFDDLASKKSSPGGGSVSAMMGLQAISLVLMDAYLTLDKKGYEHVQDSVVDVIEKGLILKKSFIFKIDEDIKMFEGIMSCYKLPKEDRTVPLNSAIMQSAFFGLEMAEEAFEILELALFIGKIGNKNVKSDAYIALITAFSTIETSFANVKINLSSVKDIEIRNNFDNKMRDLYRKASSVLDLGYIEFIDYRRGIVDGDDT